MTEKRLLSAFENKVSCLNDDVRSSANFRLLQRCLVFFCHDCTMRAMSFPLFVELTTCDLIEIDLRLSTFLVKAEDATSKLDERYCGEC